MHPEIRQSTIWYAGLLGRWEKGLVHQASDVPNIIFFMKSCIILCKNPFNYFFHKITKIEIKSFECPKSIRNYKKNTWNVRHLVNESFVASVQQTSVLYCKLLDIRTQIQNCWALFLLLSHEMTKILEKMCHTLKKWKLSK